MKTIRDKLIHLYHCRGVSWKLIYHLLKRDSTLQSIYSMSTNDFLPYFKQNHFKASQFYEDLHHLPISQILAKYLKENIHIVTIVDPEYPTRLKEIYDPPWLLFYKGDITLIKHDKLISVVGTRTPSSIGVKSTEKLVYNLALEKFIIISGMAIGIDTLAHRYAISAKSNTIAILGSGFYHIYPYQNKKLSEEISQKHLLISEFLPQQKPQRWHFPLRNRIISGISKATLVIEARSKSGSLITANQALEQGRDVYAVPGSIIEPCAEGTNELIQQGAKLIVNPKDIIEDYL